MTARPDSGRAPPRGAARSSERSGTQRARQGCRTRTENTMSLVTMHTPFARRPAGCPYVVPFTKGRRAEYRWDARAEAVVGEPLVLEGEISPAELAEGAEWLAGEMAWQREHAI